MEYGVDKAKVFVAGVLAVIFMCATAVPALAQDDDSPSGAQYGDNIEIGDINAQVCQNIIGDINVVSEQYNSGDQAAIGDGNIQAIAQEQNISVEVVQQCINLLNSSLNGGGNGDGTDPPAGTGTPDPGAASVIKVGGEKVVMAANLPTTLANTGGTASPPGSASASTKVAMLLPAGALLMAFGATIFCVRSWRV